MEDFLPGFVVEEEQKTEIFSELHVNDFSFTIEAAVVPTHSPDERALVSDSSSSSDDDDDSSSTEDSDSFSSSSFEPYVGSERHMRDMDAFRRQACIERNEPDYEYLCRIQKEREAAVAAARRGRMIQGGPVSGPVHRQIFRRPKASVESPIIKKRRRKTIFTPYLVGTQKPKKKKKDTD